jgi:hypothetical protein
MGNGATGGRLRPNGPLQNRGFGFNSSLVASFVNTSLVPGSPSLGCEAALARGNPARRNLAICDLRIGRFVSGKITKSLTR